MSHAYDERCSHCRVGRLLDAIRIERPDIYPIIEGIVRR